MLWKQRPGIGAYKWGSSVLQGALAGMLGTLPMTVVMLILHRLLPKWQKYALPPQEITDEFAKRTHLKKRMDKEQLLGAALVSHFGYGAAMGILYTTLTRMLPLPAVVRGMLFGLVVWGGSYLGLLPSLGFSESAVREPLRRNLLMILSHLVWGSTTGIIASIFEQRAAWTLSAYSASQGFL